MNKTLCLILIIISSFLSKGQSINRFSIGVNICPTYGKALYTGQGRKSFSNLTSKEVFTFGEFASIEIAYKANKRISLQAGLGYGYKSLRTETQSQPEFYQEQYTTLELPLRINYHLTTKRFSIVTGMGVITSFLARYDGLYSLTGTGTETFTSAIYERQAINSPYIPVLQREIAYINISDSPFNHRVVNISLLIAVGMHYQLTQKIQLRIEPIYRVALLNTEKGKLTSYFQDLSNPPLVQREYISDYAQQHLLNIGLNTGFYFSL